MCIRDSRQSRVQQAFTAHDLIIMQKIARHLPLSEGVVNTACLLYTSDAADERSSVDLGGRRIIKKKKVNHTQGESVQQQHK